MTVAYDPDIVLAKVSNVRRCVGAIRHVWSEERAALEDWVRLDVTVLNLQRAVEALLDLAQHLIAENRWPLPRDGRHTFQIIQDEGLLTVEERTLANAMVGFRNIAVHDYTALDMDVVRGIAQDRLGDLEALASAILSRLPLPAPKPGNKT